MEGFGHMDELTTALVQLVEAGATPTVDLYQTPLWIHLTHVDNSACGTVVECLRHLAACRNPQAPLGYDARIRAFSVETNASGISERLHLPIATMWSFYLPLYIIVISLPDAGRRTLIGVTAPAGAGKSTLCSILVQIGSMLVDFPGCTWNARLFSLSMDAYHLSNMELDARGIRHVKGSIQTIDAAAMQRDLERITESSNVHQDLKLPCYDRMVTHDPVPEASTLSAGVGIVLVEGLYLCRGSDAACQPREWAKINNMLDFTIMLELPMPVCRERVVDRKISRGSLPSAAAEYFDRVDLRIFRELQQDKIKQMYKLDDGLEIQRVDTLVVGLEECRGHVRVAYVQSALPTLTPRVLTTFKRGVASRPALVVLGLNPCVQRTLIFETGSGWQRGKVNRSSRALASVGGKGQHCATALIRESISKNIESSVTLVQICAGASGRDIVEMLDKSVHSMVSTSAHVNAPLFMQNTCWSSSVIASRSCITLLDVVSGDMTELIEPSPAVTDFEAAAFLKEISSLIEHPELCAAVCIMGTAPPGMSTTYAAVSKLIANMDRPPLAMLDLSAGALPVLFEGGISVLKINVDEFFDLMKIDPATFAGAREPAIVRSLISFLVQYFGSCATGLLKHICLTDGALPSYVCEILSAHEAAVYCLSVPAIEKVANPIGAGDTVAAVTALHLCQGVDMAHAFALGLVAGTASCESFVGALWEAERAETLLSQVRMSSNRLSF
jgi:pantothenate kinase/fructose-1-phosphate kinase PfkB-like protein